VYITSVDVCNPHGVYPDVTVIAGTIGQASYMGLPLHLYTTNDSDPWRPGKSLYREMFWASFLITRKEFPAFAFSEQQELATLVFKSNSRPDLVTILSHARRIFRGTKTVPIYYPDEFSGSFDSPQAIRRRDAMKEQQEYLYIFSPERPTLSSHIAQWSDNCELSWHKPAASSVRKYFSLFTGTSRFVQIALHYYLHASNLIHFRFIEEAGLNLQLAVEAILNDFMNRHSIRDKRRAVTALQGAVSLPYFHMEFLQELYEARNSFLAHIDTGMFTKEENINDPDSYCYEHYESVCWLITRYIQYTRKLETQFK
jgi:hypothetical protein